MLQTALDGVDWDMFRASTSDVSEFTDVALSFVNTLTEQATEIITIRTFPNQKPWVDRTIHAAVNKRTAAYNKALLSVNMSQYKASCYALQRAVRAAKLQCREIIESHFQLNDSDHVITDHSIMKCLQLKNGRLIWSFYISDTLFSYIDIVQLL